MDAQAESLIIYTVGHSNVPIEKLIDLLGQHTIAVLVDVRSMPYSQYTPQFNREALAQALAHAGIGYRFAGEYLGGRPKDPQLYKGGEMPEPGANYIKLVEYDKVRQEPWFQKGIARLVAIAHEHRTAIMCSEEDPAQCHRQHLIAETLLDAGIDVGHIRGSGSIETAVPKPRQLGMF